MPTIARDRDGLTDAVRRIRIQPSFSQDEASQHGLGSASSALRLQRTMCTGGPLGQMPLVPAMIKTILAPSEKRCARSEGRPWSMEQEWNGGHHAVCT